MAIALLVLLVWDGVWWLVLGLLFASSLPGGWIAVLLLAILLLFPIVVLVRGLVHHAYPSATRRLWLYRPFWYGQLFIPLLGVAGVAGTVVGLFFGAAPESGRAAVAGAAVLLVVASIWGYAGSRRLVVRELEIDFPELPAGLDGMRIAQLSDLHVGPHTSKRHLSRISTAVRTAAPDLIVLTGDQVDDYGGDVESLGQGLGGLRAPLGVYAIAGNHDVYAGWAVVREGMERLGWRVLVNESVEVERNGSTFWLAGTGDPAGRGGPTGADISVVPDVERTLAGVPSDGFSIVLAHNPALWPALAGRGADLTLSGHTHHGQLSIPGRGWSVASLFLEHSMGTYRSGSSVLYINPGTNYWGIPFRIGALPEVTVVTLRHSLPPSRSWSADGDAHGQLRPAESRKPAEGDR